MKVARQYSNDKFQTDQQLNRIPPHVASALRRCANSRRGTHTNNELRKSLITHKHYLSVLIPNKFQEKYAIVKCNRSVARTSVWRRRLICAASWLNQVRSGKNKLSQHGHVKLGHNISLRDQWHVGGRPYDNESMHGPCSNPKRTSTPLGNMINKCKRASRQSPEYMPAACAAHEQNHHRCHFSDLRHFWSTATFDSLALSFGLGFGFGFAFGFGVCLRLRS